MNLPHEYAVIFLILSIFAVTQIPDFFWDTYGCQSFSDCSPYSGLHFIECSFPREMCRDVPNFGNLGLIGFSLFLSAIFIITTGW